MEKIFVRSTELERALDFEKNSGRTKRERKAFRKYVWALERTEYQKAAKPYIVENSEKYIRTLISLVNKLSDNHSNLSQAEEEQLLQALALFCVRPKLIFNKVTGNDDRDTIEHDVEKFERELGRFNRKWVSFAAEIRLCEKYMFRGTRDLDRDMNADREGESFSGKLSHEEESQLENVLNGIYRAYYYELQAAGLQLPKVPSVDCSLLYKCLEKQWLLPLAHVILIRDAQCKMMGRVKYKKAALFLGGKGVTKLDMSKLSEKQKYRCGVLTYAYTMEIRAALAKALNGKLKSDCKNVFAQFFNREYQLTQKRTEEGMKSAPHLSALWGWSDVCASWRLQEQMKELEKLDFSPFSVPDCHVETIALRIAAKLELNVEQLQIVIKELPRLFWTNISFKSWFDQLKIFEEDESAGLYRKLDTLLTPICKLLNPNEYFSSPKSESELSKNVLRAAKALDPQLGGQKNPDEMRTLWNVFGDIIYFHDLTCPALLLSGAISAEYCPEGMRSKLVSYYIDSLDCSLEKYRKPSYKRWVLGLKRLTSEEKNQLIELQKNPDRNGQKRLIIKQLIGTENIEELTLDIADKFWSRPEFAPGRKSTEVSQELIDAVIKGASRRGDARGLCKLTSEEPKYMCLIIYTQLIDRTVSLVQREITKVLLEKPLQFARETAKKSLPEGGIPNSSIL